MENNNKLPKVLITDDEPKSLYAMEMLLSQEPYEIFFADGGLATLSMFESDPPDVLLLDVMMPDLTGYEVCRQLKADARWQHIPVILVTALDRKDDIVRGLEAGADEFLTKPVHGPELRARVKTMLRIKKQYDELQETLQLREDMASMIVHDMRNPISALLLYSDLLRLKHGAPLHQEQFTQHISLQAHRLNSYLGDLLLLAKMRAGKLVLQTVPLDVGEMVATAVLHQQEFAQSKGIVIETRLPDHQTEFSLDKKLMQRVLDNLLSNALKFSPENSKITVGLSHTPNGQESQAGGKGLCLQVIDQGPGVPKEYREKIFEKFSVFDLKRPDISQVGLGLAFCKLVVDAHKGRIFVEDNNPTGAIFTVEI